VVELVPLFPNVPQEVGSYLSLILHRYALLHVFPHAIDKL
jgi:hypothetical protein